MKLKVVPGQLALFCIVLASSLALAAAEQPASKGGGGGGGGHSSGGGGGGHSGGVARSGGSGGGGGGVVHTNSPSEHQTTNRPSQNGGKVTPPAKGDPAPVKGVKNPTNTKVDNKGQSHPVITRPPGTKPGIHADPGTPRVDLGPNHAWNPIHRDGRWDNWHRANWLAIWSLDIAWTDITQVTCEAVNTETGVFYPVTAYSGTGWAWSDGSVNDLEEEALDDCYAVSNDTSLCIPESDECTPIYVSTVEPVYVPAQAH